MRIPWEQRETAVAAGFDPASLTERSARRRTGDAGLGRVVVVPVYWRRPGPTGSDVSTLGLLVHLSPGGAVAVDRAVASGAVGARSGFWPAVYQASRDPSSVRRREGWTRVAVGSEVGVAEAIGSLVLRDSDWVLLCAALALRYRPASEPQDAPVERVLARFLGRLDGLDGTSSGGMWGRLALELVSVRRPERLADTRSLRWHAAWGPGGFPAGSAGRARGAAGHEMLLDLAQQHVRAEGRLFRVRTLPDWEREQAARDLGMPPRRLMVWPVSPLAVLLAAFDDITPAPLPEDGPPEDAPPAADPTPQDRRGSGPQDVR